MGDLMHMLHADQQRLEECAETIPGLMVTHFDAPPAHRGAREQRLMADNAELRELLAGLQERNAVLARRVADLSQQVRELKGDGLTPTRGCFLAHVPIPGAGGARMLLELCPDERGVVSVFIGGRLVSPDDLIATLQSERDIGAAIDAWIAGERQAADDSRAEAYAEDRL